MVARDDRVIADLAHCLEKKPALVKIANQRPLKLVPGIQNQNAHLIAEPSLQTRLDGSNSARERCQAALLAPVSNLVWFDTSSGTRGFARPREQLISQSSEVIGDIDVTRSY